MAMPMPVVRRYEKAEPNHLSALVTLWKLLSRKAGHLVIVMMAAMTHFVNP